MKLNCFDPLVAIGRIRVALITEALAKYSLWELLRAQPVVDLLELDRISNEATKAARELGFGDQYCGNHEMPKAFEKRAALRIAWESATDPWGHVPKAPVTDSSGYLRKASYWAGYDAAGRGYRAIPPRDCYSPLAWLAGYATVQKMNREYAKREASITVFAMPNEAEWRAVCERLAASINVGGAGYEYYVDRLSSAIDQALATLPVEYHDTAITIAREWDYATPDEREDSMQWNAANGFCNHGIELGCCPAGCGSA